MKKKTLEEIEALKKKYPAIAQALQAERERITAIVPVVYIGVGRMDANLLYFIGQHYDGEGAAIISDDDLRGSKYDRALFFNKEADIIGGFTWTRGNKTRVKAWFDSCSTDEQRRLQCITKATVIHWYKKNKEPITDENCRSYSYCAELVRKEIYLTLYLPPKKGIQSLLEQTDLMTNVRVTTQDITQGIIAKDQEFENLDEKLRELATKFTFSVFVRGLDKIIIKCSKRGMSGKFKDVTLRSWHMCGSIMMTFGRNDRQITLQGNDDDNPGIYVKSIDATLPEARIMVETVIAEWKNLKTPKEMRKIYKADDDTSYCGITNPK